MFRTLLAASLVFAASLLTAGRAVAGPPTEEQIKMINAAAPDKPYAKPAKPRKLLVFTRTAGFHHASIDIGAKALAILGEKTGAFTVEQTDDPAVFEPDSLARFDGVCMLSTTGPVFLDADADKLPPDEQKKALAADARRKQAFLAFIESGKGLIGIHSATDTCYEWPEYGRMIGGYFDGHPWHEEVTIKIDDPKSPLTAMFGGEPLVVTDEIYQHRDPYSRDNLHELLSLDTTRTDMNKQGIHRTDGDIAVSWIRKQGAGRVFYCSLGHRDEIFWNPKILRHYLAGIQWALGDLEADATNDGSASSADFKPLFNGKDLTGWTCKDGSWGVEDGALVRKAGGSYIWTAEQYGDFTLDLEFKIDKGANSGIFFRTSNTADPVQTGIEIQVYDTYGKNPPGKNDCGAVYDVAAPRVQAMKAPGEWNHVTLTCRGPKIIAEMNGEPIIDIDLDQWTEPGKNPDGSKNKFKTAYKDMPRKGHIGFQDHGDNAAYRNIRIRALD